MFSSKFLFRFRFPCRRIETLRLPNGGLDESYRLPSPDELDGGAVSPFDLRLAWHPDGLALSLSVNGKTRRPWCRIVNPEESDGLQICLDTRDMKDGHRATRFCHRLVFLPTGSGPSQSQPQVFWLPIHRAKQHPNPIATEQIRLSGKVFDGGYQIHTVIPSDVLTGYVPSEHPNLGFHFAVMDQELGNRYFLVSPPFPHDQDPSLWASLDLVAA
ncbi:MAG: hypothetical protein LBN39_04575 [Planctomycetaceae bacterium]|jgi:hypothetical protein|nr:hypothetical protein [Planctomycetaceae bacterium]